MTNAIDELTVNYEEAGQLVTKELDKIVLTRGAWTTILYRYQDWDNAKQAYGSDKFTIRRYQKRSDAYQQRSKFNISSVDQAKKIIEALSQWIGQD
jgi:hypothetical protein